MYCFVCVTFLDDRDNIGYNLYYIAEIPAWFKDSMVLINFMHTNILLTRIINHQECPQNSLGNKCYQNNLGSILVKII